MERHRKDEEKTMLTPQSTGARHGDDQGVSLASLASSWQACAVGLSWEVRGELSGRCVVCFPV